MRTIEVGKKYYHKRSSKGVVRQVTEINNDRVKYDVLHGPSMKHSLHGECSLNNFRRWTDGEFHGEEYARLDGAILYKTYIVLNVAGEPILRCSKKRAEFYLRKNYAKLVNEDTIQFTNNQTEDKLNHIYNGTFNEFFMAVKNDRCCVCGKTYDLTRHHVVPRRHKKQLPLETRQCLSNILFICTSCHETYERQQLISDATDPYVWKNHFFSVMNPKFIPAGWDIFSVKNLEGLNTLGGDIG